MVDPQQVRDGGLAFIVSAIGRIGQHFPHDPEPAIAEFAKKEFTRSNLAGEQMTLDAFLMNYARRRAGAFQVGRPFLPEEGKTYDLSFGKITYQGREGDWHCTVRIDGPGPRDWIDLDTDGPIDPQLVRFAVQAWLEL